MAENSTTGRLVLSRSLAGWGAAAAAFVVIALLGAALGRLAEFLLVFAPLAAAVATAVLTLLAALVVGQTRQFRPLWCTLAAGFCVYPVAASLNWSWARELDIVAWIGLIVLGFPASLTMFAIAGVESQLQLSPPEVVGEAELVLCLLVLPYLQHFVLLPKLFQGSRHKAGLQ